MVKVRREALNAILIAAGILAAAMGLKGFLLSNNLIDGGVTGVSMLLTQVTAKPLAMWLPPVNAPFVIVGSRQRGAAFAARKTMGIEIATTVTKAR